MKSILTFILFFGLLGDVFGDDNFAKQYSDCETKTHTLTLLCEYDDMSVKQLMKWVVKGGGTYKLLELYDLPNSKKGCVAFAKHMDSICKNNVFFGIFLSEFSPILKIERENQRKRKQ